MSSAWDKLHKYYQSKDWIDKPNIFAEEVVSYIKEGSKILELGAGQGQDTRYFASKGFNVISTDISEEALNINRLKSSKEFSDKIHIQYLDISSKIPFDDNEFDAIYGHLSFHYFNQATNESVINEIHRVLKPKGLLIMLNNSTNDPEYNTGKLIEKDFFTIGDKNKRFFSTVSLYEITKNKFNTILLDNLGETYKDSQKGIHNLIRYIGSKK